MSVSPILDAVYRGKKDVLAELLADRPVLNIFEAAAVGDLARARELIDADPSLVSAYAPDGFHPLGLAAFFRHAGVVRLLLDRGADVAAPAKNKLAVTALHSAVATDPGPVDMSLVRMLLDAGAPVNAPHLGGGTPLHSAAYSGDLDVIRTLLSRGADTWRRTDDGKTASDIARERGHTDAARELDHGGPQR